MTLRFAFVSLFVLSFCFSVPAGASQDIEYGRQLFQEGSWSLAYQTFDSILSVSQDSVVRNEAWYHMILCRFHQKEYEQSRSLIYLHLKESRFSPYRIPLMVLLGDIDRAQGKLSTAIRQYMKVVRSHGRSPEAFTARVKTAEVYEELDRPGEAEDIYRKLLAGEKEPARRAELRFRLAGLFRREGRSTEALEHLRNIILESVSPEILGRAQYEFGLVLMDQKEWEEARKRFIRMAELYPDHFLVPDSRYGLAWSLEQESSWTEALSIYARLSNSRPELRLNASFRKALILSRTGKSAEALLLLGRLATNTFSPVLAEESRHARVRLLADAGRLDEALVNLSSVTDRMFRLRTEAEIFHARGDYAAALRAFEPFLIAGAPGIARDEALLFVGQLYELNGRSTEALANYRSIFQSLPDSPHLPRSLDLTAAILVRTGSLDEALAVFNRLSRVSPGSVWEERARAGIADIYMKRGRYREAGDLYLILAETAFSNNAFFYYQSGQAEIRLGRREAAVRMFRKVFDMPQAGPGERQAAYREMAVLLGSGSDRSVFVTFATQVWPLLPDDAIRDEAALAVLDAVFQSPGGKDFLDLASVWLPRLKERESICRVKYLSGLTWRDLGDPVRARDALVSLRRDCSGSGEVKNILFDLVGLHLLLEDTPAAEKALEDLVRSAPQDVLSAEAAFAIGQHLFRRQEHVRSRRWFKFVEWDFPASDWAPRAVYWTGLAFLQEGGLTNALAHFETVFGKYPASEVADLALFRAGEVCGRLNRHAQAVLWLRRLLRDYPSSSVLPAGRTALAAAYKAMNNNAAAESVYKDMVKSEAGDAGRQARLNLAILQKNEAEYAEALSLLLILEKEGFKSEEILYHIADAYRRSGDCASSRPYYARIVLAEGPMTAESLYSLGVCSAGEGDLRTAADYFSRVSRGFPGSVWASRADLKMKTIREAGR